MALAWIATFSTALCFGVSAILEDLAAKQTPTADLSTTKAILQITTRRWYVLGMALGLLGWFLSLLALQRLPVFAVQAVGAASIGVVVLLHWALTRVPVPRWHAVLLVTLAAGLIAVAVAAKPGGPTSVAAWFAVAIWIGIGLMTAVAVLAFRVHGDRGAAILGAISGLSYGGTALCARALETDHTLQGVLLDPLMLALLPLAGLGIAFFASALQRGSVAVAAACQRASTTIVPAAVGLALLGDEARAGLAPLALVGFVVTVASVLGLTLVRPAVAPAHASSSGVEVLLQK